MSELDVYKLEHMCISDLMLSACIDLSADWKTSLLGYINGINTLASMMVDEMQKEADNGDSD